MATVSKRTWIDASGRRKEAWRVSYTDPSGKRRHVQRRTKRDADAYALTVEMEKRLGVHVPDADSLTIKDAAEIWLGTAEADGCGRYRPRWRAINRAGAARDALRGKNRLKMHNSCG